MKVQLIAFALFFITLTAAGTARSQQAQQTPEFTVDKPSVTAGGGHATSALFTVDSSIVQSASGRQVSGAGDVVDVGFWTPEIAPTAAAVSIDGQVLRANSIGIAGARLVLTDTLGISINAVSSPMGYFRFDNVEVGKTYILTISAKNFSFSPSTRLINLTDSITGLQITAVQ